MRLPLALLLPYAFCFLAVCLASPVVASEGSVEPGPAEESSPIEAPEGPVEPSPLEMSSPVGEEIEGLSAEADETDVMVVTATRRPSRGFDFPLPLNVIDTRDLQRSVPMSMADAFRGEAGLNVSTTGPNIVRPMIRGLFDERVLVLLDGVRLSEQRPGGNHVLSLDPAQIDRIEVVRGPASVLYGSDAIGGVMNIFTRGADRETGDEFRIHGSLRFELESATSGWKSVAHVKGGQGRMNFYAGGFYKDTDNLETPTGKLRNSFYEGGTVWLGGNYIGDEASFDIRFWSMQADIGVPGPPVFIEDYFKDERHHMLTSRFEADLFGGNLSIDFGWQRHERNRYRLRESSNPAVILGNLEVKIALDIDTWELDPVWVVDLGSGHVLSVGINSFYEDATSGRTIEDTGSGWVNPAFHDVPVIPDSRRLGLGVFAQDEISIGERWVVIPGLRFDWIRSECDGHPGHQVDDSTSTTNTAVSGNLGVLYRLDETVNLYANAGRAFRAPTLLELYFDGPHDVGSDIGNPDLEPEKSWNFDVGAKFQSARSSAFATVFYNRIQDYIVKVPVPGTEDYEWQNVGNASLWGVEFGGDVDIGDGFSLFGTLAYVEGRDVDANEPLPSIPPFTAYYGVRYEWKAESGHRVWAELGATTAAAQTLAADGEKETPGWTRIDLRAQYDAKDWLSIVLAAENLTDELYHDHLSRAWQVFDLDDQAGFNLKLGVEVRF
jgi:hemoglobin/transferrin/lactoferrin receptor protein